MQLKRRKVYFGAGPARLPIPVIAHAQSEFTDYHGTTLSIVELSHRSAEYCKLNTHVIDTIHTLCNWPKDQFAVMLMPGGGTLQFAAWIYNVMFRNMELRMECVDFVISGYWSERAAEEAEKLGIRVRRVPIVEKVEGRKVVRLPAVDTLNKVVYYCQNETIDGIELPEIDFGSNRIVICDASSNFLSRPMNHQHYTVLFAGAQKNVGVAGITIVMARRSVAIDPYPSYPIPTMLDYAVMDRAESAYNTPPVFPVYMTGLVLDHLVKEFGSLEKINDHSVKKSSALYSALENLPELYNPITPEIFRSRMNVIIRMRTAKEAMSIEEAEKAVIKHAEDKGIEGIQGHRQAGGGLRVSLYNAINMEEVEMFLAFLKEEFGKLPN